MRKIIVLAESGSDVNAEMARQYDVEVIPMHVTFDDEVWDDGSFPVEKIRDFYKETGKLPKTSACTPLEFEEMYDRIHSQWPEAHILYLAYSAVTTCTYQSAVIAAEGRDYVTAIDTKQVSAGQGAVVTKIASMIQQNPDLSLAEAVAAAEHWSKRAHMCFLPDNLEFLFAGGRVSNAAYVGSRILNLHPCIDVVDGKLVATKKYRGKMVKAAGQLIRDYTEQYDLDKEELWFIHSIGLSDEVKQSAEAVAKECGFRSFRWILAGGVITVHGGPAAFGIAGFSKV